MYVLIGDNHLHVATLKKKKKKKKKLGLPYVWMETDEGKKEGGQYALTLIY